MSSLISKNDTCTGRLQNNPCETCTDQTTTMFVRFFSYQGRIACGELETPFFERNFCFHGLDQLLLIMEDIMDIVKNSAPGASLSHRDIKVPGMQGERFLDDWNGSQTAGHINFSQNKWSGSKAPRVVLKIYRRQHASMQGALRINGQKVHFRSGVELMRLLHQMLRHWEV